MMGWGWTTWAYNKVRLSFDNQERKDRRLQEGDGEPNFGYAVLERGGACNKQVVRNSGPDFRREVQARNEGLTKGSA